LLQVFDDSFSYSLKVFFSVDHPNALYYTYSDRPKSQQTGNSMAEIEFVHQDVDGKFPAFSETIEVRVWGLGGTAQQTFYIGSGLNFSANANYWLEIIYSLEGAQIFYTRNFLHQHSYRPEIVPSPENWLDELVQKVSRVRLPSAPCC
jgi:hypothetical protein